MMTLTSFNRVRDSARLPSIMDSSAKRFKSQKSTYYGSSSICFLPTPPSCRTMPRAPPEPLSAAQRPYQHYSLSPMTSTSQCLCADRACFNALAGPSTPRRHVCPARRYVCPACSKTFTTNGHLRRHARIHTGEKHVCPFPGCHRMCSRQDNLQQQCVILNWLAP